MSPLHYAALALSALSLVSCASPRYEWAWHQAQQHPGALPAGAYEGTWNSAHNGHSGKLRCIVSPAADGFRFYYRATWATVLQGSFSLNGTAQQTAPQVWKVQGEKDLGAALGGTFTHQATLTAHTLEASYDAKFDHGLMHLHRVGP